MTTVILDTSCISAFIRTNRVNLLLEILKEHKIVITRQVLQELKTSKLKELREFENKKIKVENSTTELMNKYSIDFGESSVIQLAKDIHALAILDDKAARSAAENERIDYIGTATLIKIAIEKKAINKKQTLQLIEEITTVGRLFLSQDVKNWILE